MKNVICSLPILTFLSQKLSTMSKRRWAFIGMSCCTALSLFIPGSVSAQTTVNLDSYAHIGNLEDRDGKTVRIVRFVEPSPDLEVQVAVTVLGGGLTLQGPPLGGGQSGSIRAFLEVKNVSSNRTVCSNQQVVGGGGKGDRSTPGASLITTLSRRDSFLLDCRGGFDSVNGGQVEVNLRLETYSLIIPVPIPLGDARALLSATVEAPQINRLCTDALDAPVGMVPVFSWYSPNNQDNRISSEPVWAGCNGSTRSPDYRFVRKEGYVFDPSLPQPPGTIPLFRWFSLPQLDNWSTTQHSEAGERNQGLSPNYGFSRRTGYVYDPARPQPPGTIPLFRWFSRERLDNWTTTQHSEAGSRGEDLSPNYRSPRLQGYVVAP